MVLDELATADPQLLVPAADGWLPWTVDAIVATGSEMAANRFDDYLEADRARLTLAPNGYVLLDRSRARTTLALDHPPSLDELVHPGIATTGATLAWWQGRLALHGCAAVHGASAVAFLGDRQQGKSSTLAWLISQGWGSVSDDLLVVDGVDVFAGPRVVDLRQESAELWTLGAYLGVVGTRERWRFRTAQVAAQSRLAAIVNLEWGDTAGLVRVPPPERLSRLLRHRTLDIPPTDPSALLRAAAIPMFTLIRPRDVANIERALALVLDATGLG